jgi:UTP:GlnB (protein PII) uridylyltransferase
LAKGKFRFTLQWRAEWGEVMKQHLPDLLLRFRDELGSPLGCNLEQIVLYGFQARGNETPDSDVDVLVVLRDARPGDREKIHPIAYRLMWDREFQPLIT